MNQLFRLVIIAFTALGCISFTLLQTLHSTSATQNLASESPVYVAAAQKIDFGRHFRELGVEGSTMIYDLSNDRVYQHNPERNAIAFLPASTFKILNSLISLETGVISDEIEVLTWDGIERQISGWNRDLNMKEAIKLSAV